MAELADAAKTHPLDFACSIDDLVRGWAQGRSRLRPDMIKPGHGKRSW